MHTPPPVEPPSRPPDGAYQRSLMDRLGPDGAYLVRARVGAALAFVLAGPIFAAGSALRPATAGHPLLTGLVGGALSAALLYLAMVHLPAAGGAAALAVTAPSGKSTPYEEQYSYEESLAARGDLPGALEAFERAIAERPLAVTPRVRAAELYASRGKNPQRAAELFREVRALPGVTSRDVMYASSRLVDLYDGALDDPGRALVELRRIIELHPGSPLAAHAREALPGLKARLAARDR